jgi:hypothetical protein
MNRRRRTLVAVAALGCVAVVACLWTQAGQGVGRLGLFSIKRGMSRQEVEAILRVPPGNHRTEPGEAVLPRPALALFTSGQSQCWYSDDGVIVLRFDAEGKVADKLYSTYTPTILDKVFECVGLAEYERRVSVWLNQ